MRKLVFFWRPILIAAIVLLLGITQDAYAASSNEDLAIQILNSNRGNVSSWIEFGGSEAMNNMEMLLKSIYYGFKEIGSIILTIMIVVAGTMVALGVDDGRKLMWQYMLGIGLAINFGGFIFELFGGTDASLATVTQTPIPEAITNVTNESVETNNRWLEEFMKYYLDIIHAGAKAIQPIAIRLVLIFAAIEGIYKIAMEMNSGDKIKYIISMTVKAGFYIFLIQNWLGDEKSMQIVWHVERFFEEIGAMAAGANLAASGVSDGIAYASDSIVTNAISMVKVILFGKDGQGGLNNVSFIANPVVVLGTLVAAVIVAICMFLTALEMFLAKIELYTMMLIAIIFLPFGILDSLSFLSRQSIGALFNLSAKVMVIAFISVLATNLLSTYCAKFITTESISADVLVGNFPVLLQICLVGVLLLYLTKKIPEMVQGFLNGSPSLGGAGMMQMASSAVKVGAAVASSGTSIAMDAASGMAQGAKSGAMKMSQMGGSSIAGRAAGGLVGAVGGGLVGAAGGAAKGTVGLARGAAASAIKNSSLGQGVRTGMNLAKGEKGRGNTLPVKEQMKNALLGEDWGDNKNEKNGKNGGGGLRQELAGMSKGARHAVFQGMKNAPPKERAEFLQKLRGGGGPPGGGGQKGGAGKNNDTKKDMKNS